MLELISKLVTDLGVQESQAKGGAGLLLKLAQDKLGGDFSSVTTALPGASDLIANAPAASGIAQLAGGLLGALGGGQQAGNLSGLATLADGFSQLKLDGGMVAKFVPILLNFAKAQGGQGVFDLLTKALK